MEAEIIAQAAADLMTEAFLRALFFVVGMAVAAHFFLMANACYGKSVGMLDMALVVAVGSLGVGAAAAASTGTIWHMLEVSIALCAASIAFLLRLWVKGFHVSAFLKERHNDPDPATNPR